MRVIAILGLALTPMSAQAVSIISYLDTTLSCQSIKVCDKQGLCSETDPQNVSIRLDAATFATRYGFGGDKFNKWQRPARVTFSEASDEIGTFRSMSTLPAVDALWREATQQERENGWFGPMLPSEADASSITGGRVFQIYQTRTFDHPEPKIFKNKKREIIVFNCTVETS